MMRTGWPMSSTNTSPPVAMAPACSTSCAASGMVMKYRVTSGWVTVSGPPLAICERNSGTTLPLEPSTLPKRTIVNRVLPAPCWKSASACSTSSAMRLLAPITLVGRTALSVDTSTKLATPGRHARHAPC